MFAVISGTVKISTSSPDGRSAILNLISAGEILGEIAVLDGQARTADATANTNCEIFIIDRREFIPFVKSQPALAMKFIELLCTRLRWTSEQVEQIILQNLPGRLANALLRLTEKHKLAPGGRTIAVTQQEISEMVGMTRKASISSCGSGPIANGCASNTGPSSCWMPSRCRPWPKRDRTTAAISAKAPIGMMTRAIPSRGWRRARS
jgi:hypothetical protein